MQLGHVKDRESQSAMQSEWKQLQMAVHMCSGEYEAGKSGMSEREHVYVCVCMWRRRAVAE